MPGSRSPLPRLSRGSPCHSSAKRPPGRAVLYRRVPSKAETRIRCKSELGVGGRLGTVRSPHLIAVLRLSFFNCVPTLKLAISEEQSLVVFVTVLQSEYLIYFI